MRDYQIIVRRVSFVLVLLLYTVNTAPQGIEPHESGASPVDNQGVAFDRALAYLGHVIPLAEGLEKLDSVVALTTSSDTTSPFLSDSLRGKASWEIRISDVDVSRLLEGRFGLQEPLLKDVIVRLDSSTGCLAAAYIFDKDTDPDSWERPAEFAESQLETFASERYHGFPGHLPSLTLIDALNMIETANPGHSRCIVARFVLHSGRNAPDPEPAWSIHMFGFTPGRGPWSHSRCVIPDNKDAKQYPGINVPWPASLDTMGTADSGAAGEVDPVRP